MARKKKRWRTRTSGTPSQVGQHFIIDDESIQSKRTRLPPPSFLVPRKKSILSNPLRHKSEEEKLEDEKRKRLKELAEKKKHEKRLFGQPIPEQEEPTTDDEIRGEAKEVKVVLVETKEDLRDILADFRNYVMQTRIGRYIERKKEERTSQSRP